MIEIICVCGNKKKLSEDRELSLHIDQIEKKVRNFVCSLCSKKNYKILHDGRLVYESTRENCAWYGSVNNFLGLDKTNFINQLSNHLKSLLNLRPSSSQLNAWKNCFDVLTESLVEIESENTIDWSLIFEYELPRERGRRPDIVLLSPSSILILEFKDHSRSSKAAIDQLNAYSRDIEHYHYESRRYPVVPILVLTRGGNIDEDCDGTKIVSPDNLSKLLIKLIQSNDKLQEIDVLSWCNSDYEPLPSLVQAARNIFNNQALPNIKRAHSAGIPETIDYLKSISERVLNYDEKHLALVTGVPGAGKTLVGLKFVYENFHNNDTQKKTSVLLSGNGPLVNVLQHSLKSTIFVRDVHGYLQSYGGGSKKLPSENIWIYDEAQRAWDEERVRTKRPTGNSEPEDFLIMGEKRSSSLMIGLIGQGQEIHLGEESGLSQWREAVESMPSEWKIHCPEKIKIHFDGLEVITEDKLNLDTTLRSHLAGDVHEWIDCLLSGEINKAREVSLKIKSDGFNMYISDSLLTIKEYLSSRYEGEIDKRYGLIASSKAKNLKNFGVDNTWDATRRVKHGPWYNDNQDSDKSCCQLVDVVTEFGCQGLELDFPVICWGDDLIWMNSKWNPLKQPRSKAKNPDQLRINSYRVLLSRGRDGFVIFNPNSGNETYECLKQAGLSELG